MISAGKYIAFLLFMIGIGACTEVNLSRPSSEQEDNLDPCEASKPATRKFLEQYCEACHGSVPYSNNLANITDLASLVERGVVVPFDADNSALYQRVNLGSMPPPGLITRPNQSEIDNLRDWIDCGAEE